MTKVSIIIPFYNAEAFADELLSSITVQSFSDFEVICVNDCSDDNTLPILEKYSKADGRIRIFQTERNSGTARIPIDLGLARSAGDFVSIIGHDDRIGADFLAKLVKRQKETAADIVMGKMVFFDSDRMLMTIPEGDFDFSMVLTGREAVMMTIGEWKIGANGALIKKDLLVWQRRNSKIDPALMNADEYDTRDLLVNAKTVAFADAPYWYRQHPSSVTKKTDRQFECLTTDRFLTRLFLEKYGKHSPEYRKMTDIFIRSILGDTQSYKAGVRKHEWSAETALKIRNILSQNYKSLEWSEVFLSSLAFRRKIRFLLPFSLFLKLS